MSTIDDKTAALLASPTLEGLAYRLRHKETWPKDFEFDFDRCHRCAMGLAFQSWFSRVEHEPQGNWAGDHLSAWLRWTSRVFAIPYWDAEKIFGAGTANHRPSTIARRIDAYLATHPRQHPAG